jgi:protein-S-isoprenylcysteine O-methyltransferase Ste14
LSAKLGVPYRAYLSSVPRLFPRLRSTAAHGTSKPNWMRAVLAEILPIGVFISLAFFSWSYDNRLMGRAVLISFGVSLVTRAFVPATQPE